MEAEFWHERWASGRIGFHQETPNTFLVRFLSQLGLRQGDWIFVPLCGKSVDMRWLRGQGYKVLGVELSPIAVASFFKEDFAEGRVIHSLEGSLGCWEKGCVRIYCGDFFDLASGHLEGLTAVYDRASLIALPASVRRRYSAHLGSLLPENARILLITLEYPQEEMKGPPFSVTESELRELFQWCSKITLLASRDILSESTSFQGKVSRLEERAYLLTGS